jgi:hypothetical protein
VDLYVGTNISEEHTVSIFKASATYKSLPISPHGIITQKTTPDSEGEPLVLKQEPNGSIFMKILPDVDNKIPHITRFGFI